MKLSIQLKDPQLSYNIVGAFDKNLEVFKTYFDYMLVLNGDEFHTDATDPKVISMMESVLSVMMAIAPKVTITERDVIYLIKLAEANELEHAADLFLRRKQIIINQQGKPIYPKTFTQAIYADAITQSDMVFGVGPAGTGKTYLAVALAVSYLKENKVKKLILTRPAVEAGESLGFLPGDLKEKVDPYLIPLYDALYEFLGVEMTNSLLEKGVIEIAPLAYMRGRTLENAFIILDEAQNTTHTQMKMFLTRLGFSSKMVITGDPSQADLPKGVPSGLNEAIQKLHDIDAIKVIHFKRLDVVRNPLVQKILERYDD
ncbi:MAG: PhoH family protein [Acholeplasma sp.]|jgi:phosphate starvation-inducible PhoH-like protein|nr:PhoH family protein [Acholeplasma sp.]